MTTHDYVSENLQAIDLRHAFPEMVLGDTANQSWPYLRREIGHNWYVDRRNPAVGFVSVDEAAILYNTAKLFVGKPCLEIGCWRGWSTAHIAAGCRDLDVIDPKLAEEDFLQDVRASMARAGVLDGIRFHTDPSPAAVHRLYHERRTRWAFAFIDGDHEGAAPRRDAEAVLQYAAKDALILFHDLASPDVSAGLALLAQEGWKTRIYQTMQIMGVAWRGEVTPVDHIPDPSQAWELPAHLRPLDNNQGRSRRPRKRGDRSQVKEPNGMAEEDGDYAEAFSALQQRYVALAERYDAALAREEQLRDDARSSTQRHVDSEKAHAEAEELLTQTLTRQAKQLGELRSALDDARRELDAEREHKAGAERTLADTAGRLERAEAGLLDLVAVKQELASARARALESAHAQLLAERRAEVAASAVESQRGLLLRQERINDELASKLADLANGRTHAPDANAVRGYEGQQVLLTSEIRSKDLEIQKLQQELLRTRYFEDSQADHRRAVDEFSTWAATTRVLLGLLRRVLSGARDEAYGIALDEGLRCGLPRHVADETASWLCKKRVLIGLIRRNMPFNRTSSVALVVSTIYWAASNQKVRLEVPEFKFQELLAAHTSALHNRLALLENAPRPNPPDLSGHQKRVEELEAEVARLKRFEDARSAEEHELADLRIELEVLRHRAAR